MLVIRIVIKKSLRNVFRNRIPMLYVFSPTSSLSFILDGILIDSLEMYRTRTKNKSIIVFLIDSNLSPISLPIGVVTAVSFFPLVENKLESVQVRCH